MCSHDFTSPWVISNILLVPAILIYRLDASGGQKMDIRPGSHGENLVFYQGPLCVKSLRVELVI